MIESPKPLAERIGLLLAGLLLVPILYTACGAISGLVVGVIFEIAIIDVLSRMGMDTFGLSLWQVGAALGFLGSVMRARRSDN